MSYLEKLCAHGITVTLHGSKLKLSAKAAPGKDIMELIEENRTAIIAELKERQHQDSIADIKEIFGATELTGTRSLKAEYNLNLAKLRELETYLDDKNIPQVEREGSIPEFQRFSHKLSDLLNAIGEYSHQEVIRGFRISGEVAKND